MPRASLDEIMNGLATYQGREILANSDDTILAVETRGPWGVAFDFAVYDDGSYAADAVTAVRSSDGSWVESTDSGFWGSGWEAPWAVPEESWDRGERLRITGRIDRDVESDDDKSEIVALAAVYGFAARAVSAIRIEHTVASRVIKPTPAGAFMALEVCEGPMTLTPLDSRGNALLPAEVVDAPGA